MSHLSTSLKRCSFWKIAFDGTQCGLLWSVTAHLSTIRELGKVMSLSNDKKSDSYLKVYIMINTV